MKIFCALSYGQGGQFMDALLGMGSGIDRLAGRINAMSGVECQVFTWDQASTIANRIKTKPDHKIVVGGCSLGANEAPRVAFYLGGRAIDFMFGIQPSIYGAKNLVPASVKRSLCLVQYPGLAMFTLGQGLGSYKWQKAPGNNKTEMLSTYSYASHPGSNNEATQNLILAEIKKLIG